MLQNFNFQIDENRLGIENHKTYKAGYRFPVEMLLWGENYYGVETTLNKQHPYKAVMEFTIKTLLKGPKQYKTIVNHVLEKFTWLEFNDSLEILLLDGVIQISFKNPKPQKLIDWFPKVIQMDPRALDDLIEERPDINLEFENLRHDVNELLIGRNDPNSEKILEWLEERQIKDLEGIVIADWFAFKKYKSIVLSAAYYTNLKDNGKKLPLRYISTKIWNNTGALKIYKDEIARSMNILPEDLEQVLLPDINSTLYAPLIFISPLEALKEQVNYLSRFPQEITITEYFDEMGINLQKVCELNRGFHNALLDTLLVGFNILKESFNKDSHTTELSQLINKLHLTITTLKKEMVKVKTIRSKYELIILTELGRGSFAIVYRVFDPETEKIFACKVLFPKAYFNRKYANEGEEYILRFKREVRLLTKELQHENIISVDKIQIEGSPFWFTMPLATMTLHDLIKNNVVISQEQRLELFKQILSGVMYLHKNQKYHRDLAPNNILIFESDRGWMVKIADFGLAKDPKSNSLVTGLSKRYYGQEHFTDPEQLNSFARANHLSDIYSLGALLYYILSRKSPSKIRYVSVACQNIVMKAMSKPEMRYQSIYEFERDLDEFMKQKV
ncbi:hypothetical protein HMPREF0322_03036 [Desulfitobacterium hafniense DP7]|uniref:Protein kinase domain-containing protein n=1 Tax=Desulfitobacterium hafniense DP7 TaxID=537010 RepID=G9XPZ0_DESHA|nr:serine/threonine-protein kinase [Desulfitobacterium hafniense]EHL06284.1 hypothetical protein HMPREF0322_03036 [Desulfitobacterium hafniense DP7]